MSRPTTTSSSVRGPAAELDDAELLERCREGDNEAWSELVCRYERLVYAVPRRYGLDQSAAGDVFQEVFAILVRQLPSLRHHGGLPKWLTTTARNMSRKWLRDARRASALPVPDETPPEPPPESLERLEAQSMLRHALRRLGGRCEELILAQYAGRTPSSYKDIAERLGLPLGSLGPTRARCLKKLLELIETVEKERGS